MVINNELQVDFSVALKYDKESFFSEPSSFHITLHNVNAKKLISIHVTDRKASLQLTLRKLH